MNRTAFSILLILMAAVAARAQSSVVVDYRESISPEMVVLPVEVPPFSIEHQVRLSLEARIDWPELSGSNPWISVYVNGNQLGLDELLNKTNDFTLRSGVDLSWYDAGRWRILYSPDFEAAITDKQTQYGTAPEDEPYRFVFDITRHVKPGANEVKIEHHKVLQDPDTLVLRNIGIEVGTFIEPPGADAVEPAPTGPLPTIVAAAPPPVPMTVTAHDATIDVRIGAQSLRVSTRMSLPDGQWREGETTGDTQWSAGPCRVSREVSVRGDHIHVADTFTNTTDTLIGVMFEHYVPMVGEPEAIYLAGRKSQFEAANAWEPAHPSSFAQFEQLGVGLVAEDDVFRVHARSLHGAESFGLAEDRLGLAPKSSITLEWSIYPCLEGDYWSFVNAVRRNWGVNYEIPGAFIFAHKWPTGLTGEQYAKWMHDRGLKYICGGIAQYPDGLYAHGTGILFAPEFVARERDWSRKMAAADPDLVPIAYFHAQCCTEPDSRTKYADSRLLDETGRQIDYPHGMVLPLFVPTEGNSYGKAIWKYVDCLIDDIGAKGIYWDEMSYSVRQTAHGLPWDGCTVHIDRQTHDVIEQVTSVPLAMQSLAERIVDYIRGKGLFFMANSQAHTRTMMRKQIVRFVEGGTFSAMDGTHLGCPLGLGNHCTEDTHRESARHVREHLKRGALYYGHYYSREPAPWNFTSVMFPITPEQIGPGYVLGAERIHTTVSGRFGFPDGAAAEVYVVNAEGERVRSGMVKMVREGRKRLYEIRMPGDHFAVLVRRER
ncbi:MAG TPA: hypothetical protein DGT21_07715 [Armatimonadetes bacterium]|nr:hypothetical protein [Armatimonadota bacterium]